MFNLPSPRALVSLCKTMVLNRAKMLGLLRYFPPDFETQQFASKVEWWIEGALRGKLAAYQMGDTSHMLERKHRTKKEQGTAYWRGAYRIDEADLTQVVDIADPEQRRLAGNKLVLEAVSDISDQIIILMEWSAWQAANNGLTAFNQDGVEFQVDYGLAARTQVGTPWATIASAVPHFDIQAELLNFRGTGVTEVDIVFNQTVSNLLSKNEELIDRIKQSVFALSMGANAVNGALKAILQSAMPEEQPGAPRIRDIITYDEGYFASNGSFTTFVPDDTVFIIGSRPPVEGETGIGARGTVGAWMSSPALHESYERPMPGPFITVDEQIKSSPKFVGVEGGINGLPVVIRPTWIRRLKITAP